MMIRTGKGWVRLVVPALLCAAAVGTLAAGRSQSASSATPPGQPASGPGGADAQYGGVAEREFGAGATAVTVFVPQNPTPAQAPVVIFTHGWGAVFSGTYADWIRHIVRHEGAIVIYPRYQADLRTPTTQFLPNAIAGVKTALNQLRSGALGVRPRDDQAAYVGHSVGGLLAANLAADAAGAGLPLPRAVMSVEPGRSTGPKMASVPLEDLSRIPAGTLLLTLSGDHDPLAGTQDALRIYGRSTQIPASNKNYIIVKSDDYGTPALVADHAAPTSMTGSGNHAGEGGSGRFGKGDAGSGEGSGGGGPIRQRLRSRMEAPRGAVGTGQQRAREFRSEMTADALDFYGYWKLFDGLCEAAFYGKNREYALGNTPQQRYMGQWSDGTPVKELVVSNPR